jgi:uracil-DNA glycosylase
MPSNPYLSYYLNTMDIKFWVRRRLPELPLSEPSLDLSVTQVAIAHSIESKEILPPIPPTPPLIPPVLASAAESSQNDTLMNANSSTAAKFSNLPPQHLKVQVWQELQQQVVACTACELHQTRTLPVFGTGNRSAQWMFVGEAPGADEDIQGEPFVGRAGKLLTNMLLALDLPRETVYIANILKCRPPGNRTPQAHEVECCTPFLTQQIELIQPAVIVALGAVAARFLLDTETEIGKLRGKRFEYKTTGIPLIATYHPAYLLRNPVAKSKSWQDLQLACQIIQESQCL